MLGYLNVNHVSSGLTLELSANSPLFTALALHIKALKLRRPQNCFGTQEHSFDLTARVNARAPARRNRQVVKQKCPSALPSCTPRFTKNRRWGPSIHVEDSLEVVHIHLPHRHRPKRKRDSTGAPAPRRPRRSQKTPTPRGSSRWSCR